MKFAVVATMAMLWARTADAARPSLLIGPVEAGFQDNHAPFWEQDQMTSGADRVGRFYATMSDGFAELSGGKLLQTHFSDGRVKGRM